jgi:hypothetical protein
MISAEKKAYQLRKKMGERDAIVHATQCLVLAPIGITRDYWWNVVELIKYNGERFNTL